MSVSRRQNTKAVRSGCGFQTFTFTLYYSLVNLLHNLHTKKAYNSYSEY